MKKIKILFVYKDFSSFVKTDLEILERHFDVISHQWTRTRDIKNILRIIWYVLTTDLSFIWFAGGHASRVVFFSKIFKRRSIVVVGGYEVANVPEIDYGLMSSQKSARRVRYVLENTDKILAISEFNKNEILKYTANLKNIKQIYNGVDCDKLKPKGEKENLVITVSIGNSWNRVRLKGLDMFVESAKFLSDVKFLVIGMQGDALEKLQYLAPSNVKLIDPLSQDELIPYYQKAKVYCQLSYRESFGMALAEAMACECVPVVTDNAALPEVVGDTGFYVSYGDPEATTEAIKEALKSDKGKKAKERIENMFSMERRERELVRIINKLIIS